MAIRFGVDRPNTSLFGNQLQNPSGLAPARQAGIAAPEPGDMLNYIMSAAQQRQSDQQAEIQKKNMIQQLMQVMQQGPTGNVMSPFPPQEGTQFPGAVGDPQIGFGFGQPSPGGGSLSMLGGGGDGGGGLSMTGPSNPLSPFSMPGSIPGPFGGSLPFSAVLNQIF